MDQGCLGNSSDCLSILAYLIFEGRGMAGRNVEQAQQARDELRRVVGFSVADEIQKLDGLKRQDRSATPNLHDYARGWLPNE